jgi:hypothetical protein
VGEAEILVAEALTKAETGRASSSA